MSRRASVQIVMVMAVVAAIIGFLALHSYNPGAGLVWNVLNGEIWLTRPCPRFGLNEMAAGQHPPAWWECGIIIPYRWLLTGAAVAVAAALVYTSAAQDRGSRR